MTHCTWILKNYCFTIRSIKGVKIKKFLKEQYDGVCPDCGNDDLELIDYEESCQNCGHVFYDNNLMDDCLYND